jgi:AcrR family transcriptional regulator
MRTIGLREQQKAYTRERLLDAGRRVFDARGYLAATIDEIVGAAGASRATFYLHFKNKQELAAALLEAGLPDGVRRFAELDLLLEENGPLLRKQLHGWLAERLDASVGEPGAGRALLQAATLEPELEAHLARMSERFVDSLVRYLGGIPAQARAAARARALVLETMTHRVLTLASRSRLPVDNDSALEALADLWFSALAGPSGAAA